MFVQVVYVSAKLDQYLGRSIKKRNFINVAPFRGKSHLSRFGSQLVKLVFKVGSRTHLTAVQNVVKHKHKHKIQSSER